MKKYLIDLVIKLRNNLLEINPGKIRDWWPLLFGPAIILTVYISYLLNPHPSCWVGNKARLELLALYFTSAATIIYLIRVIFSRNPVFILLFALSVTFLCREIHFAGTSTGVYIALVILGIWSLFWQDRIFEGLKKGELFKWVVSTFSVYFLSQLVARRVFRFMPLEDILHVPFEEMLENGAHLMLITTAFSDLFSRHIKDRDTDFTD